MRWLCKIGRHVWVYIKGSDTGYTWQEECKHCGEKINRSGFDGW